MACSIVLEWEHIVIDIGYLMMIPLSLSWNCKAVTLYISFETTESAQNGTQCRQDLHMHAPGSNINRQC